MGHPSQVDDPCGYTVYPQEYITKLFDEKKARKKGLIKIELELSSYLKGTLFYTPLPFESSTTTQHVELYAQSEGWDNLTETGYRSHFFQSDEDYTEARLVEEFTAMCIKQGLNIENPEPIQIGLL